jgi:hypothetical protein
MEITKLELQGLQTITRSDFYEQGRDSITWDFSVYDICSLKGKTRSGVFSSLSQKGLIEIVEKEKTFILNEKGEKVRNPYYFKGEPNFGTIRITKLGYSKLDELGLIDEYGYFIK